MSNFTPSPKSTRGAWVPDRRQVIWLDCHPLAGREMRDVHPFLVLSSRTLNDRTFLVTGQPMTTAACDSDDPFAVAVGPAKGCKSGQASHVPCHQPTSFDWRIRGAKPHAIGVLPDALFSKACDRLDPIIGLD